MKTLLALAALLLAAPLAAQAQTPPLQLWTYQCTAPKFDSQGNATAAPVQAFFGYYQTNAYTQAQQLIQVGEVDFDLIALGGTTVTASGVTVTYAQLAQLNAQACKDRWTAKQPAQLKAAAPSGSSLLLPVPPSTGYAITNARFGPRKLLKAERAPDGVNTIYYYDDGSCAETLVYVAPANRIGG